MKFRKKPVVIDAFEYLVEPIPDWFMDKVSSNDIILHNEPKQSDYRGQQSHCYCEIKTLEGIMRGEEGDFIIQGVHGEIYPCKPDIFRATYEPVNEP